MRARPVQNPPNTLEITVLQSRVTGIKAKPITDQTTEVTAPENHPEKSQSSRMATLGKIKARSVRGCMFSSMRWDRNSTCWGRTPLSV